MVHRYVERDWRVGHATLRGQADTLGEAGRQNRLAGAVLDCAAQLGVPSCYLGAGAVSQTVWNLGHGFAPTYGIKDYDLVYFDASDLSVDAERAVEQQARRRIG